MAVTKKPQGIYVNEATHDRATSLVENALDGHGTLAGFFSRLEEALLEVARSYLNDPDRFGVGKDELRKWIEAPKEGFFHQPTNRFAYEAAWNEFTSILPWKGDDVKVHLLALAILRSDARLWQFDGAYDVPKTSVRYGAKVGSVLEDLVRVGRGQTPRFDAVTTLASALGSGYPTYLWRGGAVEVILDEPKSKSTSFYLESEAHRFAVNVFGRAFFERVERGLVRLLDSPSNWLPLEPELNFLEHGPNLASYQNTYQYSALADSLKEELHAAAKRYKADDTSDPRVQGHVFPFSWDPSLITSTGIIFPDLVSAEHNCLVLAYRLGLISEGEDVSGSDIQPRLLAAFMERFGLQGLGPERRLAYEVIRSSGTLRGFREYVSNALDLHLLSLFKSYALSVLPLDQQESTRVDLGTLATLSQLWIFPTRSTLEAYGNAKVARSPNGKWELAAGRTQSLIMDDHDAYWSAKALNAVVSVQPGQSLSSPLEANWIDEEGNAWSWLVRGFDISERWQMSVREQTSKTRFKIPLGLDVVRRALLAVRRGGEQPEPLWIGALLTAELTDEALDANGRFAEAFRLEIDQLLNDQPW